MPRMLIISFIPLFKLCPSILKTMQNTNIANVWFLWITNVKYQNFSVSNYVVKVNIHKIFLSAELCSARLDQPWIYNTKMI